MVKQRSAEARKRREAKAAARGNTVAAPPRKRRKLASPAASASVGASLVTEEKSGKAISQGAAPAMASSSEGIKQEPQHNPAVKQEGAELASLHATIKPEPESGLSSNAGVPAGLEPTTARLEPTTPPKHAGSARPYQKAHASAAAAGIQAPMRHSQRLALSQPQLEQASEEALQKQHGQDQGADVLPAEMGRIKEAWRVSGGGLLTIRTERLLPGS